MKRRSLRYLNPFFMVMVSIGLMGCSATDSANQVGGRILGTGAGAWICSKLGRGDGRFVTSAMGAALGGHVGNELGRRLDQHDKQLAMKTAQSALEKQPDNRTVTWKNPNNNHKGKFKVTKTQELPKQNKVCRDYVHTAVIDGQPEKVHGRACRDVRDAKGQWTIKGIG